MENMEKGLSSNVSTTPLRQWSFQQCLPFSWTTLRGKHCRHPIAVMGVVDTFRQYTSHPEKFVTKLDHRLIYIMVYKDTYVRIW